MCDHVIYKPIFALNTNNLNVLEHQNVSISTPAGNLRVDCEQDFSTPGIKTNPIKIKANTFYKVSITGYSNSGTEVFCRVRSPATNLPMGFKRLILKQGSPSETCNMVIHSGSSTQASLCVLFTGEINTSDFFVLEDLSVCEVYEGSLTTTCFKTLFNSNTLTYGNTILDALASAMSISDTLTSGDENPNVPVGFVFLAQFIAHELTLNVTEKFDQDSKNLVNYRTPFFDLDQVYGQFENNKFMYDSDNQLIYNTVDNDLSRNANGVPIIGDPRNDENFAIAQLQLIFIKFHNKIISDLVTDEPELSSEERFQEARKIAMWHFQYMVIHNFLKTFIESDLVNQILNNGAVFYRTFNFIPIEFITACFRFGHSTLRADYQINDSETATLHELINFTGGNRPSGQIDWEHFFNMPGSIKTPKLAKKLTPQLVESLHSLPSVIPKPEDLDVNSLPSRNLRRANQFQSASGQAIAANIQKEYNGTTLLTGDQIDNGSVVFDTYPQLKNATPLFYYFLREAEVLKNGEKLGNVGGVIITEVIIEAIRKNHNSYLYKEPNWTPTLPRANPGEYTIMDIINHATDI